MNSLKNLCIGIGLGLLNQSAMAMHTSDVRLAFASNSLTYASQQLADTLRSCRGHNSVVQDAVTLSLAAAHFKEEVELGSDNLADNYEMINEVFTDIRGVLLGSNEIRFNTLARQSWFNVEESYLKLRIAWSNQPDLGRPGGGRPGGGFGPGPGGGRPGGGFGPGHGGGRPGGGRPGGGFGPGHGGGRPGGGFGPGHGGGRPGGGFGPGHGGGRPGGGGAGHEHEPHPHIEP